MANTQFNPSNFNFYKLEQERIKNRTLIPEYEQKEKYFSLVSYVLALGSAIAFLIVSLIYILYNQNYSYEQGGIGGFGIVSICAFFTSLMETIVISYLYHHKLKHNKYAARYNRIRVLSMYLLAYTYLLMLSSIAFRVDICANGSVSIWQNYGTFVVLLATGLMPLFAIGSKFIKDEKKLRNLNVLLLLAVAAFTISNYYVLQTSVVVGPYNMWTIILGTVLIIAAIITLYSGEKKNYYFTVFQLLTILGIASYAVGLIYFGCSMKLAIPHII